MRLTRSSLGGDVVIQVGLIGVEITLTFTFYACGAWEAIDGAMTALYRGGNCRA